jgi:hypothetical protein
MRGASGRRADGTGGQVVCLTARDRAILRDLVRFGALTVEQLTRHHFGAAVTCYARMKALARAGYVAGERVFFRAPAAYVATRAGADVAGVGLSAIRPAATELRHRLLLVDLSDWLLARPPGSTWTTERELRREAMRAVRDSGTGRLWRGPEHVPDGLLVRADNRRMAIELELTEKAAPRYGSILRWYAGQGYDGVQWYCETESLSNRVRATVEAEVLEDLASVALLPQPLRAARWAQAA